MIPETDIAQAENAMRRLFGAVGTSKAEIHVNAGGFAVWIAATCCVAMLVALGMVERSNGRDFERLSDEIRELRERDNAQQAYINALIRGNNAKPPPERK